MKQNPTSSVYSIADMERNKRMIRIIALCGMMIAIGFYAINSAKVNVVYHGKKLSEWEEIFKNNRLHFCCFPPAEINEAIDAVQKMRDIAIPVALRDLEHEPPKWAVTLLIKADERRSNPFFRYASEFLSWVIAGDRGVDGQIYFEMLGPSASNAVPSLISIIQHTRDTDVRRQTIFALGNVGQQGFEPLREMLADPTCPDHRLVMYAMRVAARQGADIRPAVPLLLTNITSNDAKVSEAAVYVLGQLTPEPDIVVPVLANDVLNTNEMVSCDAINILWRYRNNAKARMAIPALRQAIRSPYYSVRDEASNVLKAISP